MQRRSPQYIRFLTAECCTDLRRKHSITGFDDHQTEHYKDQTAHDLTAALERHISTHLITTDGTDQRRDAHGEEHLSVNEVDNECGDVGREVYHLGAARRGQERDAEYRGKGQNQEGSGARADQSVLSADKQADEEGLYCDLSAERCKFCLIICTQIPAKYHEHGNARQDNKHHLVEQIVRNEHLNLGADGRSDQCTDCRNQADFQMHLT